MFDRSLRQRKTKDPCLDCGLHKERCICAQIPRLEFRSHVALLIHAKEIKRTTNTGQLAVKALLNSSLWVRGEGRSRLDLSDLCSGTYQNLLLYPSAEAVLLSKEYVASIQLPIRLIVPDGNWRQAGKAHLRHLELADVPRVHLSRPSDENLHLRHESKKEGMSTLQAIAHALAVIEGTVAAKPLLDLYQAKLKATLLGRGERPAP